MVSEELFVSTTIIYYFQFIMLHHMEMCLMHVFTEYWNFIGTSPTQINGQYNNMVGWSCSEKSCNEYGKLHTAVFWCNRG